MQLTAEELKVCQRLQLDKSVAQTLKDITSSSIEAAQTSTSGQSGHSASGFASPVEGDFLDCVLMVEKAREGLPEGWQAFYSTRETKGDDQQEIVVLHNADEFAAVYYRTTNGDNYDVSHSDIVAQLREWGALGVKITGAAADYVAVEFNSLPNDICAFAEGVYRFCPDAVEQGVGLMDEEEDPEFFEAARELCPTISDDLHSWLVSVLEGEDDCDEAIAEIEMGVRLLANHLKTYKSLFLWWD